MRKITATGFRIYLNRNGERGGGSVFLSRAMKKVFLDKRYNAKSASLGIIFENERYEFDGEKRIYS